MMTIQCNAWFSDGDGSPYEFHLFLSTFSHFGSVDKRMFYSAVQKINVKFVLLRIISDIIILHNVYVTVPK